MVDMTEMAEEFSRAWGRPASYYSEGFPALPKVDLVAEHLCRLLAHMDRLGQTVAVPVADDDPRRERRPLFDMKAGYVQRTAHLFPQQGSDGPWTMPQVYAVDRDRLRHGPVEDPVLRLSAPAAAPSRTEAVPA
jgi:hypothetical protein